MITLNGFNDSRLPEGFELNLNDPSTNLKHFARLMGSSDSSKETVGYYGGHLFASLDNKKLISSVLF